MYGYLEGIRNGGKPGPPPWPIMGDAKDSAESRKVPGEALHGLGWAVGGE